MHESGHHTKHIVANVEQIGCSSYLCGFILKGTVLNQTSAHIWDLRWVIRCAAKIISQLRHPYSFRKWIVS